MENSSHAIVTSSSPRQPVCRITAFHVNLGMYHTYLPDNWRLTNLN